jgi:O-antigen ligase
MIFPLIALLMRWRPHLSMALVLVLTVEITISYVRTALVALILLLLVYIFVSVRRRRFTALVLAVAFGVTGLVVQERLATRFSDLSLLVSGDAAGAGSNRVALWTSNWEATTSSVQAILAGAGAGASHAVSDEAVGHYVDAHNVALEFLATGGVLLVAAYLVFLGWAIKSIRTLHRDRAQSSRARAVAAIGYGVIIAFVVTGSLVSISFYAALVAFALFLGLIRGMHATPGATCFDSVTNDHRASAV